jgi:hypothetical protein
LERSLARSGHSLLAILPAINTDHIFGTHRQARKRPNHCFRISVLAYNFPDPASSFAVPVPLFPVLMSREFLAEVIEFGCETLTSAG